MGSRKDLTGAPPKQRRENEREGGRGDKMITLSGVTWHAGISRQAARESACAGFCLRSRYYGWTFAHFSSSRILPSAWLPLSFINVLYLF